MAKVQRAEQNGDLMAFGEMVTDRGPKNLLRIIRRSLQPDPDEQQVTIGSELEKHLKEDHGDE